MDAKWLHGEVVSTLCSVFPIPGLHPLPNSAHRSRCPVSAGIENELMTVPTRKSRLTGKGTGYALLSFSGAPFWPPRCLRGDVEEEISRAHRNSSLLRASCSGNSKAAHGSSSLASLPRLDIGLIDAFQLRHKAGTPYNDASGTWKSFKVEPRVPPSGFSSQIHVWWRGPAVTSSPEKRNLEIASPGRLMLTPGKCSQRAAMHRKPGATFSRTAYPVFPSPSSFPSLLVSAPPFSSAQQCFLPLM